MASKKLIIAFGFCLGLWFCGLIGCATHKAPFDADDSRESAPESQKEEEVLQFQPCTQLIPDRKFAQKVDNFIIVFDPSASMAGRYKGHAKNEIAIHILNCINTTIPPIKLKSAIRTFGNPVYTSLIYDFSDYTPKSFAKAVMRINPPEGTTPMSFALRALSRDLFTIKGKTAVIIISDGKDVKKGAINATNDLMRTFPDLCIYSIVIGDDAEGLQTMTQMAEASGCGIAVQADYLMTPQSMQAFVERVFLTDRCLSPEEAKTLIVFLSNPEKGDSRIEVGNEVGQQVVNKYRSALCLNNKEDIKAPQTELSEEKIQEIFQSAIEVAPSPPLHFFLYFENNAFEVTPSIQKTLDEIISAITSRNAVAVKIEGHADRVASEPYNDSLSMRRAQTVQHYLIDKQVTPQKIKVEYFGETKPAVKTDDNVAEPKNRRVEVIVF